jgi:WD40 repeat protein
MTRALRAGLIVAVFVLTASAARPAAPPWVGRDRYGDPLPAGALARLGTLRYRLSSSHGLGLGFTPDGEKVVSATHETVEVFESKTGRRVLSARFDFYAAAFALSRDGKQVAVAGYHLPRGRDAEGVVRVVSVADGKEVRTWLRGKERTDSCSLAFSADGKLLASLNGEGLLRLEEIRSGEELYRHRFTGSYPAGLTFSPDGKILAAADSYKVHLWRWKDGGEPVALGGRRRSSSLAFSPDGKTLAIGGEDDEGVQLFDVTTNKRLRKVGERKMTMAVRYSPDGKYLAATSYLDRALIVWDAKSGDEVRKLPCGWSALRTLAFSRDSGRVATLDDGVIRIWDVASGKLLSDAESHSRRPNVVRLLKDDVAVTSGDDGTVRFWDARTGKQTKRIDVNRDWTRAAALSPDGKWLAASDLGEDHAVSLWDPKTGKRVYRLAGHGRYGGRRALAFTADSKRLASWGDDQYLRLWDVKKGKAIEEHAVRPDGKGGPKEDAGPMDDREMGFLPATLSADARLFATSSADGVFVFDVASGKQKMKFKNEDGWAGDFSFSPDNKTLLVAASGKSRQEKLPGGGTRYSREDPPVILYDLGDGGPRKRVTFQGESIGSVAWRPDGKRFAVVVSRPKPCVRFFDNDGQAHGKLDVPLRPGALSYSPDGKRLIISLDDTTVLVYDVAAK